MTSVEFLSEQIRLTNIEDLRLKLWDAIEQAKEMHKKEIMQAVYDSMGTNFDPNMGRAELYYNTTFKSE